MLSSYGLFFGWQFNWANFLRKGQSTSFATAYTISPQHIFSIGLFDKSKCVPQGNKIVPNTPADNTRKQESPPAWTQEAYRPPCSEYSFCCPILAGPPPPRLDWPPGWTDPPHWTDPPPAGLTPPPSWTDPPLWTDRQTRVKTLPSRRTTYAGGKYRSVHTVLPIHHRVSVY